MLYMLNEGIRRIIQMLFGLKIFDFPPLLFFRNFVYQYMFSINGYPEIEAHVVFTRAHSLHGYITVGQNVFLGSCVKIDYSGQVIIGNNVWISENASIYTHSHVLDSDRIKKIQSKIIPTKIKIEDGVWIGANAIILESVSFIGANAIIGAGSIVTKDVSENAVVAGNPATIIKRLES